MWTLFFQLGFDKITIRDLLLQIDLKSAKILQKSSWLLLLYSICGKYTPPKQRRKMTLSGKQPDKAYLEINQDKPWAPHKVWQCLWDSVWIQKNKTKQKTGAYKENLLRYLHSTSETFFKNVGYFVHAFFLCRPVSLILIYKVNSTQHTQKNLYIYRFFFVWPKLNLPSG